HLRRQVDPTHRHSPLEQIAGDVSRPAAHIAGRPEVPDALRKPVEKLLVQRFVPQLIEDAADVLIRHAVVAGLKITALLGIQGESSPRLKPRSVQNEFHPPTSWAPGGLRMP